MQSSPRIIWIAQGRTHSALPPSLRKEQQQKPTSRWTVRTTVEKHLCHLLPSLWNQTSLVHQMYRLHRRLPRGAGDAAARCHRAAAMSGIQKKSWSSILTPVEEMSQQRCWWQIPLSTSTESRWRGDGGLAWCDTCWTEGSWALLARWWGQTSSCRGAEPTPDLAAAVTVRGVRRLLRTGLRGRRGTVAQAKRRAAGLPPHATEACGAALSRERGWLWKELPNPRGAEPSPSGGGRGAAGSACGRRAR